MLDRHFIRDNPKVVKTNLKNRGEDPKIIDEFLTKDEEWRKLKKELDNLRGKRNRYGVEIATAAKGMDAVLESKIEEWKQELRKLKGKSKEVSKEIKEKQDKVEELVKWLHSTEMRFPNLISKTTPIGEDENSNPEIFKWGEVKKHSKDVLPHHEFTKFGVIDFERGAKLGGHRFSVLSGWLAKLERSLMQFMLNVQTNRGYREVLPPFLVRGEVLEGTGQLPKFEEDLYKCSDDLWLIPTAEVPLTNLYREEILEVKDLPINICGATPCFRREAGAYGKDIKGYIRQHQFNKVELVKFTHPDKSYKELDMMLEDAKEILKLLEIPFRVVELCSGDIGFGAAKTYDLEVWIPSQDKYREVSSVSNCEDFQARRANIKFRDKGELKFVHTLNGSGLAIPRLIVAIMENYQEGDKLIVPKALVEYMGVKEIELTE